MHTGEGKVDFLLKVLVIHQLHVRHTFSIFVVAPINFLWTHLKMLFLSVFLFFFVVTLRKCSKIMTRLHFYFCILYFQACIFLYTKSITKMFYKWKQSTIISTENYKENLSAFFGELHMHKQTLIVCLTSFALILAHCCVQYLNNCLCLLWEKFSKYCSM